MALTEIQLLEVKTAGEAFLTKRRPSIEIRAKVDLAYKVDRQSVLIYSIRPSWVNPSKIMELPVAKATYSKPLNLWKIYWLRANN